MRGFARLHLDGTRVLSPRSFAAMAAHQVDLPDPHRFGDSWGLDWIRYGWSGHRLVGHDGNTIGQSAFLRLLPEQGLTVALLANERGPADLYEDLYCELFGELAGVEQGARATARLARTPVVDRPVPALLRLTVRGTERRHDLRPDARAALHRMLDVDLDRLGRAAEGFADLARAFDETRLRRVPSVFVTADRKESSGIRRAHARLAAALDAPLVSWPGAEHAVHLTHPDEVLDVCRDVLAQVGVTPKD